MRKIKYDDRAPKSLKNFVNTTLDFESLINSHAVYLFGEADKDADTVDDKDSIYLRSGYMLLCSAWEAFVEDIIIEASTFMIDNCSFSELPKNLIKSIALKIKSDKNEISPWLLADDNWRLYAKDYIKSKVESLNSPKSIKVNQLFKDFFSIEIVHKWEWDFNLPQSTKRVTFDYKNTINWLDGFISDRGAIAHGRHESKMIKIGALLNAYHRILKICTITNNILADFLSELSQKEAWDKVNYNIDWTPYLKIVPE